jgi:hypothetical protein
MSDQQPQIDVVNATVPQARPFNPSEHLIQIKSGQTVRDYLPVQWRLVWFRSTFPAGSIETEMTYLDLNRETEEEITVWNAERRRNEKVVHHAKGFVIFKATVKDGQGGVATGTKSEKAASFADFIEKAETGAIGRALAALGYGTQFTGDEWDEAHRIVDSPVERSQALVAATSNGIGKSLPASLHVDRITAKVFTDSKESSRPLSEQEAELTISEQQIRGIRKLSEYLNKPEPDQITALTNSEARQIIQQLTSEYKEARQNSKAS